MKVLFISLGCDKNLVDSEMMLGFLREKGYELTNEEEAADVIVVNTCCFIHDAKEESINTILEMAEYKKTGTLKALIVTGCLAQRYHDEIRAEIPEVDALIGTTAFDEIVPVIEEVLRWKQSTNTEDVPQEDLTDRKTDSEDAAEAGTEKTDVVECLKDINYLSNIRPKRVNTTGGYFSYLKIAEGCDKHCTYCVIPKIRGDFRSVPMEDLLLEAQYLAESGVKELILVAQETTVYGTDLYGKKALPELLTKLCKIEGLQWIRLMYCYPEEITRELIDVMKNEPKICHYLDIPIQHASDAILKRMGRRTSNKELRDLIALLRAEMPDIVLRTSLITGFPGETEGDHEILKDFVREMRFERLGVFTYSKEEGTPAAKMKGQITKKVKVARQKELMRIQQEIAFAHAEELCGKELTVMIEGRLTEEEVYIGRTYMDAPNVDGYIFVKTWDELLSGEMVKVEVTEANGYDLIGYPVEEEV